MAFVTTTSSSADFATPAELYRHGLHPRAGAVPGLWGHQTETLRTYVEHAEKPDVALELPTGTGKTITGLLIAEWTRRTRNVRVAYACPTKQLARQVAEAAHKEGIDVSLLIGSHHDWPAADQDNYETAQAIAITTYSSIFNTNPHIESPDLIIFDDAHAGEQYVGEEYAVTIKRTKHPAAYDAVLASVAPGLDGVFLERIRAVTPDPSIHDIVRMVAPLRQPGMVQTLRGALGSLDRSHSFSYAMIAEGLAACLVYVSYSGILIRPYLPPTHRNAVFSGARQRLYLSATLGNGGELERAFGRTSIFRLEEPSEAPRYGRRFFVFPNLVPETDPRALTKAIVEQVGKAIVLAPTKKDAEDDATQLAGAGWTVLGIEDVEANMDGFRRMPTGILGLAGRYDGLDLPGDSCRLVVLDGVPEQNNLQERFLSGRARAGLALAERVRTRVVQGAGRCTRGPQDWAVVVVLGADLSRYLGRPETIGALDPELQAEIRFGRENSVAAENPSAVQTNVEMFRNQDTDETWREQVEPALSSYRSAMPERMPPGTQALADAVSLEVEAWTAAGLRSWAAAAGHAVGAARAIGMGGNNTKGYRAFWLYLAALWMDQAADEAGEPAGRVNAEAFLRQAEAVMGLGSWVREMAPLPTMERSALSPADVSAVATIASVLETGLNVGTHDRLTGEMHVGLQATDPALFEPALTYMGKLAGAEAWKPGAHGRCDSVWCWSNDLWLALEAKSDHDPTGVVAHLEIQKANDQLRLIAGDRGVAVPPDSATVMISPKSSVHHDGITGAEAHVHLVAPSVVQAIGFDLAEAWAYMIPRRQGLSNSQLRALAAEALGTRGALPSQLLERLTRDLVAAAVE